MSVETPRIIRESSRGYSTYYSILDEMLSAREVECVGTINADSVYSLCRQLRHLQREDPRKEITMYINSPGGSLTDGLALYDVMKGISCPVRTVCLGLAASMGAFIFAAGNERDMLPELVEQVLDAYLFENAFSNLMDDKVFSAACTLLDDAVQQISGLLNDGEHTPS